MSSALTLLLCGLFAVLVSLVAVLSAMLERPGPIRLRHWIEEAGGKLRLLYDHPARFETFRYLLSALATTLPAVFLVLLAAVVSDRSAEPSPDSVLIPLAAVGLLVFGVELLNRFLVSRNPEKVLRRLTIGYRAARVLLLPLVVLAAPLFPAAAVQRQEDEEDDASDEEIEAFLDVGTTEGILDPGEEDLILRVMDFGDELVRSVMTPRIDVVGAPVDTDLEDLAELVIETNHSRIPLYGESIDEVRGVLHIRDLLRALRSADPISAESLVLPPFFVPETKPLVDLLRELQAAHQQMAIVVDEYGGTAGLVTVEDLLEEIVGEIVDEHDEEEPLCEQLADGTWRMGGMIDLDRLTEIFAVEVEEEPYETVGGLVFGLLGNVPEIGAVATAHGLRFEVESVGERRIDALRVTSLSSEMEGSDDDS